MNQKDAPNKIRGIVSLRKMEIGEIRQKGDYYLHPFGDLILIEEDPKFFNRMIREGHVPHYRVHIIKPFKENKIVKLIDNGVKIYK